MLFWIVGAALAGTTKCQCQWGSATSVAAFTWPTPVETVAKVQTPNGTKSPLACGTVDGKKVCTLQGEAGELARTESVQIKGETLVVAFPGSTEVAGVKYENIAIRCSN
jgi:hypothetical protein